jgi:hypothetical protein
MKTPKQYAEDLNSGNADIWNVDGLTREDAVRVLSEAMAEARASTRAEDCQRAKEDHEAWPVWCKGIRDRRMLASEKAKAQFPIGCHVRFQIPCARFECEAVVTDHDDHYGRLCLALLGSPIALRDRRVVDYDEVDNAGVSDIRIERF